MAQRECLDPATPAAEAVPISECVNAQLQRIRLQQETLVQSPGWEGLAQEGTGSPTPVFWPEFQDRTVHGAARVNIG